MIPVTHNHFLEFISNLNMGRSNCFWQCGGNWGLGQAHKHMLVPADTPGSAGVGAEEVPVGSGWPAVPPAPERGSCRGTGWKMSGSWPEGDLGVTLVILVRKRRCRQRVVVAIEREHLVCRVPQRAEDLTSVTAPKCSCCCKSSYLSQHLLLQAHWI